MVILTSINSFAQAESFGIKALTALLYLTSNPTANPNGFAGVQHVSIE